ncbi:alpha/beta hydrolase [Parabacteroides sp. OttesenSCG-928-N08]|nr:alpha/beta hydrolase [Parabacteroides sp. OttesenSCG-928-N08]
MKGNQLFLLFAWLMTSLSAWAQYDQGQSPRRVGNVDTIRITNSGNHLFFDKPIHGVDHLHARYNRGTTGRSIPSEAFSVDGHAATLSQIFNNLHGIHRIPSESDSLLRINDLNWHYPPVVSPKTAHLKSYAMFYDCYFEDAMFKVDDVKKIALLNEVISYIPEGHAAYETVFILERTFVLVKANIGGVLYSEWFRFEMPQEVIPSVRFMANEFSSLFRPRYNAFHIAGKEALEEATGSLGKSLFKESLIFYRPDKTLRDMSRLNYERKAMTPEEGVTIYSYYFRSNRPKANLFFIHGNGGNVSTYRQEIETLVAAGYNVYLVDWRGYGESTGTPEYRGVLLDTETAFEHFLSRTTGDGLPLVVYGMSLGGQLATKIVSDRQEVVDALILEGSLSSAENLALDYMPEGLIRESMKRSTEAFNQQYIAENDIRKITNIPKLIIHSATDEVVSFYHGERLFRYAQAPKFFWETETHHTKTLVEQPKESIERIDRLLEGVRPKR